MKKVVYLISITFFILQACSSNDSSSSTVINDNLTNTLLVGKWEIFQGSVYPAGTVVKGNEPLTNFNFACPLYKDYIQFGSQGTVKFATYNSSCSEEPNITTYTKTDFLINFYKNSVYDGSWEIISLTNTNLKVKYPSPSTGTPVEIIVLSFKKV